MHIDLVNSIHSFFYYLNLVHITRHYLKQRQRKSCLFCLDAFHLLGNEKKKRENKKYIHTESCNSVFENHRYTDNNSKQFCLIRLKVPDFPTQIMANFSTMVISISMTMKNGILCLCV